MSDNLKSTKDNTIGIRDLQKHQLELEQAKDSTYFYNTYIRKEGQKVLTTEEYESMVRNRIDKGLKFTEYTLTENGVYNPKKKKDTIAHIHPKDNSSTNLNKTQTDAEKEKQDKTTKEKKK